MKKHLFRTLLLGAVATLLMVAVQSCNKDVDNLKTRVTVLEGLIRDLEKDIQAAMKTGETVVSANQDASGAWTLILSGGKTINIPAQGGGGSTVTVEETADAFIIAVNGTEYVIPKGGAGIQLVYSPEYVDGLVKLDNSGAIVKFLTNTAIDLSKTSFDIAEAHELQTRAGAELFRVSEASTEGEMLVLKLKGAACAPGALYAVSVVADFSGRKVISNYFNIAVDPGYEDQTEQIGDFKIKSEYNPSEIDASGFCSATVSGENLVAGMNLKDLFSELPEGARFVIGKQGTQPNSQSVEKWSIINEALDADGNFAWKHAPRTDFNVDEKHGFLFKVVAGDVTKAKIYLQINNPLADGGIDWFPGFGGQFEAEWHSRTEALPRGENAIDLAYQFNLANEKVYMGDGDSQSVNPDYDINLIFGGKEFFTAYSNLVVSAGEDKTVIEHDGTKLVPGDYGKKFLAPDNEGIGWFNRGFNVDYQEGPDQLIWDDTKEPFSDKGEIGIDWWWGNPNGNAINIDNERPALVAYYGVYIDNNGVLHTNSLYGGFAMRLAVGIYFDYAYGTKNLSKGDQLGLMFINRRRQPEGVTQPHKTAF